MRRKRCGPACDDTGNPIGDVDEGGGDEENKELSRTLEESNGREREGRSNGLSPVRRRAIDLDE